MAVELEEIKEYKITMLGESQAGKTALRHRGIDKVFIQYYVPTVGASYSFIKFERLKLTVSDVSGGERFSWKMLSTFLKKTVTCLLVFDVTEQKSFDQLSTWLHAVKQFASNAKVMLVGTKTDLSEQRVVTKEAAEAFMQQHGLMGYMEVSAKTGENVNKLFETIANEICERPVDQLADIIPKKHRAPTPDTDQQAPGAFSVFGCRYGRPLEMEAPPQTGCTPSTNNHCLML
jgi:small GTP-binding protein